MVKLDRVVSVGFLTERDLEVLGTGFNRHFPLDGAEMFADLLAELDKIEVEPLGRGIVIRPHCAE